VRVGQRNRKKRFRQDPSVRREGGGLAPEGHVSRCQHPLKDGSQCRQWSLRGMSLCKFHAKVVRRRVGYKTQSIYDKRLSGSLKELMTEASGGKSRQQQLDLAEELKLSKVLLVQTATLYDKVMFGKEGEEASAKSKLALSAALRDSINEHASLAEKFARILHMDRQVIPGHHFEFMAQMIARILYNHIEKWIPEEQHDEFVNKVMEDIEGIEIPTIDDKVKLTGQSSGEDDIRRMLIAMDESVEPEPSEQVSEEAQAAHALMSP